MPAEAPALVIVEDDPDDRFLILRALRGLRPALGIGVAADGVELMQRLEGPDPWPRLILLDLNLPRMDGREVLARVRTLPQAPQCRVVVFTTSVEPEDRSRALALGAADVLSKPDGYGALVSVMRRLLDAHLPEAA